MSVSGHSHSERAAGAALGPQGGQGELLGAAAGRCALADSEDVRVRRWSRWAVDPGGGQRDLAGRMGVGVASSRGGV